MIRSFRDRNTRRFFEGYHVAAFQGFANQATRRLAYLDSAESLQDLACGVTAWRHCRETGPAGTAFGSTGNGGYASAGRTTSLLM